MVEGGLSPSYVLDEMQFYEVPFLIKAIEAKRHPAWEQSRMVAMIVANALGAKIKTKDLAFPWEEEKDEKPDVGKMREKLNRLRNKK